MDSPPPSQLPRVRRKEFGEHPPVLGMDPRRLFLAFLLQASVLSIVVYQMYAGGALAVARDYAWVMSPWTQPCGLLEHKEFILVSDNVVRTFGSGPGYGELFGFPMRIGVRSRTRVRGAHSGGSAAHCPRVSASWGRLPYPSLLPPIPRMAVSHRAPPCHGHNPQCTCAGAGL